MRLGISGMVAASVSCQNDQPVPPGMFVDACAAVAGAAAAGIEDDPCPGRTDHAK
ncbi:hypothetical protein [Actinomadura spongiicola]|uniref:hypothetical protein n=1 Tax=Actinomadura spongiicola TaxID=2303421 RepID=UPI001314755C|nr:hypothetical protein [Actinomadura spongiicola]